LFEEFGPSEAHDQHRRVKALDDRVEQVEHGRLGPVCVLEHDDQGPLGGEDLEEAPDGPRGIGGDRLPDAEYLRDAVGDGCAIWLAGKTLAERDRDLLGVARYLTRGLREELDKRRKGDTLAVGGRLSDEDGRPFADGLGECRRKARLPHTGGREDRDKHARSSVDRVVEGLHHRGECPLSADHRRLGVRVSQHAQNPVGAHRLGLPFQREGAERREVDSALEHPDRGARNHHVSRVSHSLEPRGGVEDVP
jgi:hypothetical protein